MKNKQSSSTAEGIALVRAIESSRPASDRLCFDPYARALVPSFSYTMSKLVINSGLYTRMSKGALEFILARERYIDDYLKTCLRDGLDQVVILGAGFDTRAYSTERIPGIDKVKVFEVDHPATQAEKLKRLTKVLDPLPANVVYVPVDFNTQKLEDCLAQSGYSEHARTLFIWQGVTVYLTQYGVDSTLAFIARHAAPGSAVIFDYFYKEILKDKGRVDVKNMQRSAKVTGEGYIFGIKEGEIKPFLSQRGFHNIHSVSGDELKQMSFTGPNAGRVLPAGVAIASAKVRSR